MLRYPPVTHGYNNTVTFMNHFFAKCIITIYVTKKKTTSMNP